MNRQQKAGITDNFTIDVDRAQLRAGGPVLIQVELRSESVEAARERVRDDGVEHVFVTSEGERWFYARIESQTSARGWTPCSMASRSLPMR